MKLIGSRYACYKHSKIGNSEIITWKIWMRNEIKNIDKNKVRRMKDLKKDNRSSEKKVKKQRR
nr:hypothetical protein [Mycoplasmopsis bovis]QQH19144.1 hypothetical protein HYE48_03825 [Mycoplasmopsis bovis]